MNEKPLPLESLHRDFLACLNLSRPTSCVGDLLQVRAMAWGEALKRVGEPLREDLRIGLDEYAADHARWRSAKKSWRINRLRMRKKRLGYWVAQYGLAPFASDEENNWVDRVWASVAVLGESLLNHPLSFELARSLRIEHLISWDPTGSASIGKAIRKATQDLNSFAGDPEEARAHAKTLMTLVVALKAVKIDG